ncbi:bifunctional diguanylate cyclase/phosphodiesterase [Phaeobacter sp. HF9A]|uniref:putative bifunctional diguanylate cyclase/phosphodiesterase n=1 Tax=Phaeobacter sp. HF9A TaxID=2721561 RepID=UPI0020CA35FA|nr:bifunctional diguanylate cyclase/phosphodiesterase [Phaeobacter sp. HF9A]
MMSPPAMVAVLACLVALAFAGGYLLSTVLHMRRQAAQGQATRLLPPATRRHGPQPIPNKERHADGQAKGDGVAPAAENTTLPLPLHTRLSIKSQITQALARAAAKGEQLALMLVDLDRFRDINDHMGDEVGDQVLMRFTAALRSSPRPGLTIGTLGGDEFLLLVERLSAEDCLEQLAKEIAAALGDEVTAEGLTCRLSASIGIAQYPADGHSYRDLMQAAKVSLSHAKSKGRGQISCHAQHMERRTEESLQLENDLHHAIANNELLLHYQPQIDLRTGRCVGAEALLRWQHPQKGMLFPGGFVPLALDSGLSSVIDHFVLQHACAQIGRWKAEGYDTHQISINVSAATLLQPGFSNLLLSNTQKHDIDLRKLELEVLESTLFPRMRASIDAIEDLCATGIDLAIDDFGTGYSSLAMLKDLPISRIKLDRQFIKNLPRDQKDDRIVAALIAMGRSMGINVIAEGIETREQKERLIALGCTHAQGYYFSRPVSADDFAARWMKCEYAALHASGK